MTQAVSQLATAHFQNKKENTPRKAWSRTEVPPWNGALERDNWGEVGITWKLRSKPQKKWPPYQQAEQEGAWSPGSLSLRMALQIVNCF